MSPAQTVAAVQLAIASCPLLVAPGQLVRLGCDSDDGFAAEIPLEDRPDLFRLRRVDRQTAGARIEVVPHDEVPPGPFAFLARSNVLVAGSLQDNLPLELREREQDIHL